MYNRIHNPDPEAMSVKVTDGDTQTHLNIPAQSSVVVSQKVAAHLQNHYAHLEVSEASEEEYKAHKAEKDAQDKAQAALEAANAKKAAKVKPADPKAHENFLAQEARKVEAALKADMARAAEEERKVVEQVKDTVARLVGDGSLPSTHKTGK